MNIVAEQILTFAIPGCPLPPENLIFGGTEAMAAVRDSIGGVAATNVPVLFCSESGAGKEVMARYVHGLHPGRNAPFIKVGLISQRDENLDGVLARIRQQVPARDNKSDSPSDCDCTLYFDEVADLNSEWQAGLKQLLQADSTEAAGDATQGPRLRIICATNRALEQEVDARRFRQDLLYCINAVTIWLSPLRERARDIPDLVDFFLRSYRSKFERDVPPPSARLIKLLQSHNWPGNVRELDNLIKRYVLLGSEEGILSDFAPPVSRVVAPEPSNGSEVSLKNLTRQAARDLERKIILKVLREKSGNRTRAARALNISYRTLLYKLKEVGVPPAKSSLSEVSPENNSGRPSQRYHGLKEGRVSPVKSFGIAPATPTLSGS